MCFVSALKISLYLRMLLDQGKTVSSSYHTLRQNKAEEQGRNLKTEHAGHTLQKYTATSHLEEHLMQSNPHLRTHCSVYSHF